MQIAVHPLEDDHRPVETSSRAATRREEGSGFVGDDTFFDDEDYQEQVEPIMVNFQCEYMTGASSPEVIFFK